MATEGAGSLAQLQSSEQVALLDAIDDLRGKGLNHHISLPQLIVCGDQSSGKSSVLEGLTRLRFPAKEGLCTTFATEVVLRKEATLKITCSIIPGNKRTPAQQRELVKFKREYSNTDDFQFTKLVEDAKRQMAHGHTQGAPLFFDDILKVRYAGPSVPSLTIVDLPGLIQSQLDGWNQGEGVQQVHALVDSYMHDEKSIILAVVSARNDLENQAIFKKLKAVDPQGIRSLGIITKPDLLDSGSETEGRFMRLANNQIMPLTLGWHVLRNRSFNDQTLTDEERDRTEREFFATGQWSSLPRSNVGIDTLRSKLSEVLLGHICKELPIIRTAIAEIMTITESEIACYGKPRDDTESQRLYLTRNAEKFQRLTNDALRGIYNESFFALPASEHHSVKRLRTEIQHLNRAFAYAMYSKGHAWNIEDERRSVDADAYGLSSHAGQQYDAAFDDSTYISRSSFLRDHVGKYVQRSLPAGLPSIVNDRVIGEVFRDQASKWQAIALYHIEQVFHTVKEYIHVALQDLMDPHTYSRLLFEQIDPELDRKRFSLEAKLDELLLPYREQDPITYGRSFLQELDTIRCKRYKSQEQSNPSTFEEFVSQATRKSQLLTDGPDDYTNLEILDQMQTYYKTAILVFIDNVAVLAVENCLIKGLADVFSPSLVASFDQDRLRMIASESETIRTKRTEAQQKLQALKAGNRILGLQQCKVKTIPTPIANKPLANPRSPFLGQQRPHTPAPQVADNSTEDNLASALSRLSVTPPNDHKRRPSSRNRDATPKPERPVFGSSWARSATAETDTEDEENYEPRGTTEHMPNPFVPYSGPQSKSIFATA